MADASSQRQDGGPEQQGNTTGLHSPAGQRQKKKEPSHSGDGGASTKPLYGNPSSVSVAGKSGGTQHDGVAADAELRVSMSADRGPVRVHGHVGTGTGSSRTQVHRDATTGTGRRQPVRVPAGVSTVATRGDIRVHQHVSTVIGHGGVRVHAHVSQAEGLSDVQVHGHGGMETGRSGIRVHQHEGTPAIGQADVDVHKVNAELALTGDGAPQSVVFNRHGGTATPPSSTRLEEATDGLDGSADTPTTSVATVGSAVGEEQQQQKRGLAVYTGKLPRRERESTGVLRLDAASVADGGVSPKDWMDALTAETRRSNQELAKVMQIKAAEDVLKERSDAETIQWRARAERRRLRERKRRHVRKELEKAEKSETMTMAAIKTEGPKIEADTVEAVAISTHSEPDTGQDGGTSQAVTAEEDVAMPEPFQEFKEALTWSTKALDALQHVDSKQAVLLDGFAKLAVTEADRMEALAAGNIAGENDTRAGVARQLVTAAAGLRAIAADSWSDTESASLEISRARRRFEKRVRKAVAKEQRMQRRQDATTLCPSGTFLAMDDKQQNGLQRARRLTREEAHAVTLALPHAERVLLKMARRRQPSYRYHSSSIYEQPAVMELQGMDQPVRVGQLRATVAQTMDLLPTATVEIHGQKRTIKIDTGAQYCVAGSAWSALGTRLKEPAPVDFMVGFSGVSVRVLGVWRFKFRTQYQQPMQVDALIVECDSQDFLLGEDWMYSRGVKIDFTASEMKWYREDEKVVVPFTGIGTLAPQQLQTAKVRVMRSTKVATQTRRNLHLATPAPEGTIGIFSPKTRTEPHLFLAPTLTKVENGRIVVPILSLQGRTTKFPSKEALGTWTPMDPDTELHAINGDVDVDAVRKWLREVLMAREEPLSNEEDLAVGEMSATEKEVLLRLLRNYPKLIEPRQGCPPMTTLGVEHAIHTGTKAPIKVRPRRYAKVEQEVIDAEVEKMLRDGVIEASQGAWGFPIVLVKKKDGSVRFCIDYRLLNAITEKDVYPLPRIDDTLENMHGARRFSSLDLHAGYWQVPVAAADRDKTGFVTRQGLFRFIRMPFGLANAPGTFQRMMDAVLRGLTWQCCLVYLDDVIIYTNGNVAKHVIELAAVLERLSRAGLSLKATKCSFGTTRLEYLGHELDAEGTRPLERLVKSVKEFPVPTDESGVKRFVHMAGFYRRFIPNFGTKAAPLTKLLRKSSEWKWEEPQQLAFEQLKRELSEKPLLAYPDFTKPFKLVTDASVVGLGAALMQDQGRGDQPVAYASKVNSVTVAKYAITELECAAVVWAVKLFRPYLYGRRFELVTDHSALRWLMTAKDLTGRLHRWALQLQEYDFSITYRPGSTNVVADALSRAPVRQVTGTTASSPSEDETATAVAAPVAAITVPSTSAPAGATPEVTDSAEQEVQSAPARADRVTEPRTVTETAEASGILATEAAPVIDTVEVPSSDADTGTELEPTATDTVQSSQDTELGTAAAEPGTSTAVAPAEAGSRGSGPEGEVPTGTTTTETLETAGSAPAEATSTTATTPATGQLTDLEIRQHQSDDKQVAKLLRAGRRGPWTIVREDGLVYAKTTAGERRVVLPAALRHKALREAHDSIFSCHLRIPQTLARVSAVYWWPGMAMSVRTWVRSCRDCGTRKARPKEVIPPLRALGLGDVCDRWALDIAGPLPITLNGNRYVIAAVEYATRYAIAVPVAAHTAKDVAKFIMERIILVHGPMRELIMDGAPELNGKVIEELVALLQAKQSTPVPYRPALLGLVERFHRTWKDMLSMYVAGDQKDWDEWLPCAVYAYNGARHSTTNYSPNELLMGRRLRAPNELLRTSGVTQTGAWADYHRQLVEHMSTARELAGRAAARDQARREKYYNRRTRRNSRFRAGDLVWVLRPPRGRGVTKLAHRWIGPARIQEDVGYDNWSVERLDTGERFVTHVSFLTSYHGPDSQRDAVLQQLTDEFDEDEESQEPDVWGHQLETGGDTAISGREAAPPVQGEVLEPNVDLQNSTQQSTGSVRTGVEGSLSESPTENRTGNVAGSTGSGHREAATTGIPKRVVRAHRAPTTAVAGSDTGVGDGNSSTQIAATGSHGQKRKTAGPTRTAVRKKRQRPDPEAERQHAEEQRRRSEADRAAREARAAKRSAARDRPAATEAKTEDNDDTCWGTGPAQPSSALPDSEVGNGAAVASGQDGNNGHTDVTAPVQALRSRGRPRKKQQPQNLRELPVVGQIVELGQRCQRNKAGRYEKEYLMQYRTVEDGPLQQQWVRIGEYQALVDTCKLEDELGGDGE